MDKDSIKEHMAAVKIKCRSFEVEALILSHVFKRVPKHLSPGISVKIEGFKDASKSYRVIVSDLETIQ